MLIYVVYIGGHSTKWIFKYALIIGLSFWTLELLILLTSEIEKLKSKFKIRKKD